MMMAENTTAIPETIQQYFGLSFYICILKCCLSPWILHGNGLTVVIATRFVTKVTPTHVAVGYLALIDFMIGMTPWFHLITYLTQGYKHWRNWCTFTAWVDCFLVTQNTTAIMLVAVERCFCITKWKWYSNKYTVARQKLISGASCLFLLLMSIIYIILGEVDPKYGNCYFDLIKNRKLVNYKFLPTFVVVFSVFSLCYGKIIHFLCIDKRSAMQRNHQSRMKRTTSLIALVVTIYTLTTVPTIIYITILSEDVTRIQVQILNILIFVYYCNSIVNPIIYTFRIPEFKKAYCKILDRICNRRRNEVSVINPSGNNMNIPHESRRILVSLVPLEPRRDVDMMFRTSHV